ncbi:MAG: alpha/beta fold hydrolase [Solirubrobacterales bacterium]|nr:alpha/beta fold hydrolase [Solirubrobacterales bacterium]
MTAADWQIARELLPFEHHYLELDGSRIHYLDEGSGDTVLLLHGNPAWSFLYRKIIAGLRDEFRCVAPDYPGYGLSSVGPAGYQYTPREHSKVVERFIEALELRDLTVMVQDWGGPIGLGLAGRRPELIRALIIGNTFAWPNTELRIRGFSAIMGGAIGRTLTEAFNLVPRFFFWRGFAQPLAAGVRDAYMAPWRDRARRLPATIGPRQLIAAAPYLREVESGLEALSDRPALIVWGEKDFAFDRANRARFEAAFPSHETHVYPDASHFLQEDVGDQIAQAFKSFHRRVVAN